MNYSVPRRMLWFAVIMGRPEMARRPATPHIYFRPWQSLCHARSRKPATEGKTCSKGKWLVLGAAKMPFLSLAVKSRHCWSLQLSMLTSVIFLWQFKTHATCKWSYLDSWQKTQTQDWGVCGGYSLRLFSLDNTYLHFLFILLRKKEAAFLIL